MYTDVSTWVLIVCTSIFTLVAAFIDYRTHRIPNKLTLPAFIAGWVFQLWAYGGAGLLDGLSGFAIGFGMYFILWLIGGGGGGDAKLAGAVSVWLGFEKTLGMIIVSTVFVILGTGFVMLWSMLTKGVYKTKNQMLPSSDTGGKSKKHMELLKFNKGRVGMTFALSVALATIVVTLADPIRKEGQANRQRAAQQRQNALKKEQSPKANPPVRTNEKPAPAGTDRKTSEKPESGQKKL